MASVEAWGEGMEFCCLPIYPVGDDVFCQGTYGKWDLVLHYFLLPLLGVHTPWQGKLTSLSLSKYILNVSKFQLEDICHLHGNIAVTAIQPVQCASTHLCPNEVLKSGFH